MYRTIIYLIISQFLTVSIFGQQSMVKLNLKKGQEIIVELGVVNNRFQTAGAQVINFKLTGSAVHKFTVTDIAPDHIKLHHELQRMKFDFDGMGQKNAFDSNIEEDMNGPFGPYIKDLMVKKYDFELDTLGRNMLYSAFNTPSPKPDDKLVTIIEMLKPLMELTQPPMLGPGMFSVIQGGPISPGLKWAEGVESKTEKSNTTYIINSVSDTTILVDMNIRATCNSASEMMGHVTKTSENKVGSGKIIYDRKTGLIKEKTATIDSNGTTEAMGGTVPINGKISITFLVNSGK
jgi:hypothetical protein